MLLRKLAAGIAVLLCLNEPARGAMYTIDNPAANIYNPATRMNNPNPLSPPVQPVSKPPVTDTTTTKPAEPIPAKQLKEQPKPKPIIRKKRYYSKTVRAYITAAKKAFDKDDYKAFISITEEALKRINAGTLKATKKEKQQLVKYKIFGYGLLEQNEN
jgi:hypothetical protein